MARSEMPQTLGRQARVRAAGWKSISVIGDCERDFGPVDTLEQLPLQLHPYRSYKTRKADNMDSAREWLTWSFSPTIGAMLFTLLLALSLPIIFHLILYRQSAAVVVPSFVLLGPSGAGKTTLLTLVRLQDSQTHNKATNHAHSSSAAHRLLHTRRRLPRPSPAHCLLASRLNLTNIAPRTTLPRKSVRSK